MGSKTILLPTDFSPLDQAALQHATTAAQQNGATLLILHIAEPPFGFYGAEVYAGKPDPDDPVMLEKLRRIVPKDDSIACEHCVRAGDPAHEIVKLADEKQVDMIVMATHGRRGLDLLLRGSVTEHVVRHTVRPVLVVHAHAASSR